MHTIDTELRYRKERESKNEANDCTVRALASLIGLTYNQAHEIMRDKAARTNGFGTMGWLTTRAYESVGLTEERFSNRPTFNQFMKSNPNFTGIIGVRGHVFTVKNGTVYGNWNDADRKRARVIKTYTL
jgi:hypothetical protein